MALTTEQRNERLANPNVRFLKENLYTCDGKEPYVFISYKSDDWRLVLGEIVYKLVHDYNLHVYFDGSFAVNNDLWIKQFTKNMNSRLCLGVIAFFDNIYCTSYATLTELMHSQSTEAVKYKPGKDIKKSNLKGLPVIPIQINGGANIEEIDGETLEKTTGLCGSDSKLGESNAEKRQFDSDYENIRSKVTGIGDAGYKTCNDLDKATCFQMVNSIYTNLEINDNEYDPGNITFYEDMVKCITSAVGSSVFGKTAPDSKPQTVHQSESTALESPPEPVSAPAAQPEQKPGETKSKKRASVTGDITYTIYGKEYTHNQADMLLNVFAKVLKKHPDKVSEVIEKVRCTSAVNYELPENKTKDMPSRYLHGQYFKAGSGIFVGTGLNLAEKLRNIANLLNICGEDYSVLQSEQIELSEKVGSKAASSGSEAYSINGKTYNGNQTQMMVDVIKYLFEKHFDKRAELSELLCVKLAPLSELQDSTYFRTGGEFTYQGVTYSIGTSFSRKDKLKQISKAIAVCGEDISGFNIEGLNEIGEQKRTPDRQKHNFYDE